ncbi:MAG: SDR family NAD(P)-dependent oxidoreductase [Nitrospirae bacterium]|nr:SDR family NAD(P)-dependent oxidoreductase [Nitrospirota bacterium]
MKRKIALITGGSRGLGRTIALTLAGNGYTVVINYVSHPAEAEKVAEEAGGGSFAIRADIALREEVSSMAEEVRRKFGRLDLLINNAGIAKDNLLVRQSEGEWDEILGVNLGGCFNTITAMSPLMIKSGGGHIINISSLSGVRGKAGQAAYSASKAALLGLTLAASRELGEAGIRVNAVLPGYLMTEMGMKAGKAAESARKSSILNTAGSDREVADFVLYLAGTRNITGQIFSLDSRIG